MDLAATVLEGVRARIGIAEPLLVGLTAKMLKESAEVEKLFKAQFDRLQRYSRRHFLIFITRTTLPNASIIPSFVPHSE